MHASQTTIEFTQPHLEALYGREAAPDLAARLDAIIARRRSQLPSPDTTRLQGRLTEHDAILITYGDQVHEPGAAPLETLADFCLRRLPGAITGIHILPFYPYSSDDGFAVIDYRTVDPTLGDWSMLAPLRRRFALMFDAVINHISSRSAWFQAFLQDDPRYRDYFITVAGAPDLSRVVRPRTLPLLTQVDTPSGVKAVWTTFSADQIDLNYANPDVLLEMIDLLLFYVSQGAELIRLDAIAYLWKEIGTTCIHLPQTHTVIRLLRLVLDAAAAHVFLITETNVPHRENLTYFGDGTDEAQLVYNFALPPLALHTLLTGDSRALSGWAADLQSPSARTTFFNFLASHDGIGLNPVRAILAPDEIDRLVAAVEAHGGRVSYKQNPDGTQSPYELNISFFDALSDPGADEPLETQVRRMVAAHAILCALPGVPGVYFHSLFGSRSWPEGVAQSGRSRSINRQKLLRSRLEQELADPRGLRRMVFDRLTRLLQARSGCRAFHPNGAKEVIDAGPGVFGMWRFAPEGPQRVLCLHNITPVSQAASLDGFDRPPRDLIGGEQVERRAGKKIVLEPYQVVWLAG